MSQDYVVAVVGATGAVGREMVQLLEERRFPIKELRLLASPRSAGQEIEFQGKHYQVEVAEPSKFAGCELALFSAGGGVSKELAPEVWKHRCIVIDNSSAWRMDPLVPLVVPEVNPEALDGYGRKGIIGNPNCSTIQMVVALQALHQANPVKRVLVSTYQSASGAGQKGIEELQQQTVEALNVREVPTEVFPKQLAFNAIPQIDVFQEDGYTREEHKMIFETRKIMGLPTLPVSATCVRLPVFCGHSEVVTAELTDEINTEDARKLFREFPGITVLDDPSQNEYPTPLEAAGQDDVYIGRIRQDRDNPRVLHFWVVADNLRKGAALNAVQIAELMITDYL